MADPRAFISFDFDNNKLERDFFIGQAINSRTPFNIEDWSSKTHLPEKQWQELIKAKINRCNLVVVLVGKKDIYLFGRRKRDFICETAQHSCIWSICKWSQ